MGDLLRTHRRVGRAAPAQTSPARRLPPIHAL